MDAKTRLLIEVATVVATLAPKDTPELDLAIKEVIAEDDVAKDEKEFLELKEPVDAEGSSN